ncbi:hypothetical protein [Roseivirga sp. E12]|uniref:dCTP deaminase domain-containing protein n=1 Tax=Roseivirga sp. E12 TaxID=2819237 RepID=UPI001ABD03CC|nr:hypothetical protein [Roseivirga sp. E12]MBO3700193.1 hypothetical protein [Roseivirga sp. E12]
MILNHEEIKSHQDADGQKIIISDLKENHLTQGSYNLSIGKIFDNKGIEYNEISLEPQGIVSIVSDEYLEMPKDIMCYTTIKNGMSRKGLLAINIGIIDSGYKGKISSHLINFGRVAVKIKKGEPFLRLTFHKLNMPKVSKDTNVFQFAEKVYEIQRRDEAIAYLGDKFLNIDDALTKLTDKATDNLKNGMSFWFNKISVIAAAISIGAFLMFNYVAPAFIYSYKERNIEKLNRKIDSLENKLTNISNIEPTLMVNDSSDARRVKEEEMPRKDSTKQK